VNANAMKVQMLHNKNQDNQTLNIHEIQTPMLDKIHMLKTAKLRQCPSVFGTLSTYSKQE
jgi:hypothetical protein